MLTNGNISDLGDHSLCAERILAQNCVNKLLCAVALYVSCYEIM